MSFGVGYSHNEMGDFEFGGYYPRENSWFETVRPYVKINHEYEDGASGYLQWFGNFANSEFPSLLKWSSSENDIEGQFNFEYSKNHNVSLGGNYRFIRINSDMETSQDIILQGEPFDEQMAGLFMIDHWQVSEQLAFESQVRGDW